METEANPNTEGAEIEEAEIEEAEIEEGEPSESKRYSLESKVSALLFSSARPLSVKKLAECLELKADKIEKALSGLKDLYSDEIHGFSLEEIGAKWQFRSAADLGHVLRKLHPPKARRISRAAAETLAVIAYKQPVQRAEVESIRGVDALPTIKTLLDAKLVRIVGKEDIPGTPALYGTTELFLEKFSMNDLSDLPTLRELEEIESEPGEVDTDGLDSIEVAEEDSESSDTKNKSSESAKDSQPTEQAA